MTTRPRNDAADDLLHHISRCPSRDPDGFARTYERLHREASDALNGRDRSPGSV